MVSCPVSEKTVYSLLFKTASQEAKGQDFEEKMNILFKIWLISDFLETSARVFSSEPQKQKVERAGLQHK